MISPFHSGMPLVPGTWAQFAQSALAPDELIRPTCWMPPEEAIPPVCTTPLEAALVGVAPRACKIGSPLGPTRPGTVWPRVTVPKPPMFSFLVELSVLAHPPPKPANNAKVAAVRFIISPNGRSPPDDYSRDPFALSRVSTTHPVEL
jgi:hypothetical protein